jgi:hypothetical protein
MTAVAFSMAYKSLQVVVAAFWKPPLSRAFSVFQPLFLPQCFLTPSSPSPPLSTLPLLLHRTKKALTCSSLSLALSLSPPNSPTVRCFASLLTYPSLCLHFPWT